MTANEGLVFIILTQLLKRQPIWREERLDRLEVRQLDRLGTDTLRQSLGGDTLHTRTHRNRYTGNQRRDSDLIGLKFIEHWK